MRILLDTNLWSYISERGEGKELATLQRNGQITLVHSPAVLLEVLRTNEPELRKRIVKAMFAYPAQRLRTEADMESEEIISEVRRLRPEWLLPRSRMDEQTELRKFWSERFWQIARKDPDLAHTVAVRSTDQELVKTIVGIQRINKDRATENAYDLTKDFNVRFTGPLSKFNVNSTDQRIIEIEWWRIENHVQFSAILDRHESGIATDNDKSFLRWLQCHLDLNKIAHSPNEWFDFWAHRVDRNALRRCWIRWAVNYAQVSKKVVDSNPFDSQISSYLFDVDLFCTADRKFCDLLETIRTKSGIGFCRVKRIFVDKVSILNQLS